VCRWKVSGCLEYCRTSSSGALSRFQRARRAEGLEIHPFLRVRWAGSSDLAIALVIALLGFSIRGAAGANSRFRVVLCRRTRSQLQFAADLGVWIHHSAHLWRAGEICGAKLGHFHLCRDSRRYACSPLLSIAPHLGKSGSAVPSSSHASAGKLSTYPKDF
jgi:hypothetical protein